MKVEAKSELRCPSRQCYPSSTPASLLGSNFFARSAAISHMACHPHYQSRTPNTCNSHHIDIGQHVLLCSPNHIARVKPRILIYRFDGEVHASPYLREGFVIGGIDQPV